MPLSWQEKTTLSGMRTADLAQIFDAALKTVGWRRDVRRVRQLIDMLRSRADLTADVAALIAEVEWRELRPRSIPAMVAVA